MWYTRSNQIARVHVYLMLLEVEINRQERIRDAGADGLEDIKSILSCLFYTH